MLKNMATDLSISESLYKESGYPMGIIIAPHPWTHLKKGTDLPFELAPLSKGRRTTTT